MSNEFCHLATERQTVWSMQNRQSLLQALKYIQVRLEHCIHEQAPPTSPLEPGSPETTPSALSQLCQLFGLSEFERDLLLLCAGLELVGNWDVLCSQAQRNPQRPYPTFNLALTVCRTPYWQAFSPDAPLRYWRLLEVGESATLTQAPLRLDERILHYLMGVYYLDLRLATRLEPLTGSDFDLAPSHAAIATQIVQLWQQTTRQFPVVQLCGANEVTKRAIAQQVARQIQAHALVMSAELFPTTGEDSCLIQRLLEREWQLSRLLLVVDLDYADRVPPGVMGFIDTVRMPLMLSSAIRHPQRHRSVVTLEVEAPTLPEQHQLWLERAESSNVITPAQIRQLVSHFSLTPGQIQSAILTWQSGENANFEQLWEICRTQSRPRLDELAQRIDAGAAWDDLVLPDRERQVLQTLTAQVRQRMRVYQDWGFGQKQPRGLGISALFSGASGTGKTLAAEAIASDLKLDLYRIDLSSIVSKYIGETEKNLRKLFDAAEGGGVILLFDEADALFGKRSEVKDSRDRHANVEVAYLLQRMEAFQGLAILTTNLKNALDQAFLRRIRFVINFPFPKAPQRAEIWRRIFPEQTPTKGLDYDLLGQLEIAGGNIKSIAMNAAFIAAETDESVQMKHLLHATRSEYLKIDKILTDAEIRDWV